MPADLVPHTAIPELASRVTPEMLKVLRDIQAYNFILNDSRIPPETLSILRQLTEMGLVDPAYEGDARERPYLWSSNGNGVRVIAYRTGIRAGPHYEIPSSELARWLEEQGNERWWNVDGDPLLTGRMMFPCPAEQLARELRKINRPLLVQAKKEAMVARGQPITKDKLNDLVDHFAENLEVSDEAEMPRWSADRLLYLCWNDTSYEWLLTEDSETTEQMKAEDSATVTEAADVNRE